MPREHLAFKALRNATRIMALQISEGTHYNRDRMLPEPVSKRPWLIERATSNLLDIMGRNYHGELILKTT